MENAIERDIDDRRFHPYIQLHEFETVLFLLTLDSSYFMTIRYVAKFMRFQFFLLTLRLGRNLVSFSRIDQKRKRNNIRTRKWPIKPWSACETTDEFFFFEMNNTYQLTLGDVFKGLRGLQDDSCDLCIVDPPYGASTTKTWAYGAESKVKGFGGDWKLTSEAWDLLSQNDSFLGTFEWLKELKRIIKPTGSIWIHSTYHNSGFVNVCCQLLGLEIINEIAWYKRNSFPNLSGRRLTASHETILWVHKGGEKSRKYTFNYEDSKSFSAPYDMLKEPGKQMRTVWDIPNNKSKEEMQFGSHPTQKPIRVAERILLISGVENGTLLVPFAGSGTEMVAGLNYGMNVIGFEIDTEYYNLAKKRLDNAINNIVNSLF